MSYPLFNLRLYYSVQARLPPLPGKLLAQILWPALQYIRQVELRRPPSLPNHRYHLLLPLFCATSIVALLLLQGNVRIMPLITPDSSGANSSEHWEEPGIREEIRGVP